MADKLAIYTTLSDVQVALKVPKAQKNTFGGYNYRSCEDILEALKPVLAEHKLTLIVSDELVNIGERYYVKATAQLSDGTDFVEAHGFAREEETKKGMDGSQITGAASSYARKYALNGLFNIDDTEDADTDAHHKTTSQPTTAPAPSQVPDQPKTGTMATEKQGNFMTRNFEILGVHEPADMLAYVAKVIGHSVASSAELTKAEAKKVIDQQLGEIES